MNRTIIFALGLMLASVASASADTVLATEPFVRSALATKADAADVYSTSDVDTFLDAKQNTLPAGTAGQVITYSGTAGTVGSRVVDSAVTSGSNNLVTSGAVATAVATATIVGGANAGKVLMGTATGYEWIEVVDVYVP